MDLILKNRGYGKTYELIKRSAETGYPIVTPYPIQYIVNLASEVGLKIPEPVNIGTMKCHPEYYRKVEKIGKVLVDDIDKVLQMLLEINVEIDAGTMTPIHIKNECKKENENMYNDTSTTKAKDIYNSQNELFGVKSNLCLSTPTTITPTTITKAACVQIIEQEMSEIITDIKIIVPNKVVEITFGDNTKEKMVVHKDDSFDLYKCCFIAISKHLYKRDYTLEGIEYKAHEMMLMKKYIKIVKDAIHAFNAEERNREKEERIKKEKEDAIKRRKEKRWKQKEKRMQRLEEERRQQLKEERKEMVDIIVDAICKSKKKRKKIFGNDTCSCRDKQN